MKRDEVLSVLARHRDELMGEFGVKSLALFGSAARNETTEASDVDLLVEFDQPVTLFDLVALQHHCERLLGRRVDVVMRDAILPPLREEILKNAVDVR